MQIFTIGYEGQKIDDFIAVLLECGIETVIDVRAMPLSRKRGFSKRALGQHLKEHSIGYEHWKALGCPTEIRNQYRDDGNWQVYTRGYLEYLETQGEVVAQLRSVCDESRCCLLCFEADANFCHRSFVAAELTTEDEIVHLTANSIGLALAV